MKSFGTWMTEITEAVRAQQQKPVPDLAIDLEDVDLLTAPEYTIGTDAYFEKHGGDPAALKFTRGAVVTCPSCGHEIMRAVRDIAWNETLQSDAWFPPPKSGAPITTPCPDCRAPAARMNGFRIQLHTDQGWL